MVKPRSYLSLTGRAVLAVLEVLKSPYTITRGMFNKRKSKSLKRGDKKPIQAKYWLPPLPIDSGAAPGFPLDISFHINDTLGQATEPHQRCGFHSIPIELKRMIYSEFIHDIEIIVGLHNSILWGRWQENLPADRKKNPRCNDILSLLLTCRQM